MKDTKEIHQKNDLDLIIKKGNLCVSFLAILWFPISLIFIATTLEYYGLERDISRFVTGVIWIIISLPIGGTISIIKSAQNLALSKKELLIKDMVKTNLSNDTLYVTDSNNRVYKLLFENEKFSKLYCFDTTNKEWKTINSYSYSNDLIWDAKAIAGELPI